MRLVGLDALRGIAASLVVAHHLAVQLGFSPIIDLGKLGVAIFFLISGFVIPFSLERGVKGFAISRATRLLPTLWLSIALCLALGAVVTLPKLLANAAMLVRLFGQDYISEPYWTLSWELYFYALVACFAPVIREPKTVGILTLIIGLCAATLIAPLSFLLIMLCGTLLRMVLLERHEKAGMWLRAAIVLLVGVWFLWYLTGAVNLGYLYSLAIAFPTFILLWNRLSHPVLLWLGAISYPLYLFHYPIILALGGLPPIALAFFAVTISLGLAALVHRYVELPFIALGRKLAPAKPRISAKEPLAITQL